MCTPIRSCAVDVKRLRMALTLVGAATLVPGCVPGWRLDATNDTLSAYVIRIERDGNRRAWSLDAQSALTLMSELGPPSGVVELLDPDDCTVLARADLPERSSTLFPVADFRTATGHGIVFAPEVGYEPRPAASPDFTGC